jgi:transcriptional regulator with PAS, ATPase and Fis domain
MSDTAARLAGWAERVGAEALLDTIGRLHPDDVVFAVDGDRRVVFWSDGAERTLGYGASEAVGEHCLKVNRCMQCVQGCGLTAHGAVQDVPITLYTHDGAAVSLLKNAQAFFDDDGTFLGGVEILRPATAEGARPQPAPRRRSEPTNFHGIISVDPHVRELFEVIDHVAETEGTVLIRGESGTGKELVARALHDRSHRREGPFVALNCAALSAGLLESELFGHVRGAFTGAVRDRPGVFTRANGGTLFLDEVAELPMELQAKLLRVLQEQCFVPVGGTRNIQVDVRIVAATHRSLRAEVQAGRFREDLMYRLRVIPLYLPPLRDRRGDVEVLLWHFIEQQMERGGRSVRDISPEAMRTLLDHTWPGNVRELINVIEYAMAVGRGPVLGLRDLPPEFREPGALKRARTTQSDGPVDEESMIREALERSNGHIGTAADLLGMSRPTFWRKRKKYGI